MRCLTARPHALALSLIATYALVRTASAIDGPLSPKESLKYLQTEPGLKVELVAAEPTVVDPVAVAWDEKGRMYVVEDRGYPTGPGKGKAPLGQVVLLEDTDGDGKYDKRTVYATGLTFPNGVMPWKGGVYVTCAPNLYYFKDTNDDGVADVKEVVFKGFQDLSTTQLRVSHPTLNLDNWVYLTSGLTAAKVTSPAHPERPVVFLNRTDGRFRPDTDILEPTAGTAQFGQTFDSFGRKFVCSNRNHIQQVVMDLEHLKRNPALPFSLQVEDIPDHEAACRVYPLSANVTTAASHTGYFTSACGVTIFQGEGLPDEYYGNSFTCEPAGNLVHHDVLTPNGSTFKASRRYPTNEFLASPDNWFRAVNLANGPDGALYVCDMYRKTIEHPDYLPEAVRKVTDFESGKDKGRIYKVVSASAPPKPLKKFDLGKVPTKELCGFLENRNVWWRMTAQRLLLERQDLEVVPLLREMVKNGKTPEARVHALRSLDALGVLGDSQLELALVDPDPDVREHGLWLSERRLDRTPKLEEPALKLADDPSPRVRFVCALALGALDEDVQVPALARIANKGFEDRWTRAAVLTSIQYRERKFFAAFLPLVTGGAKTAEPQTADGGLSIFMTQLGHVLGAAVHTNELASALGDIIKSSAAGSGNASWQMAAAAGFGQGLRVRTDSTNAPKTLMSLTEDDATLKPALARLFQEASKTALAGEQPVATRQAAISLLGQAEFKMVSKPLETLVEPQQPGEIQSAAIRTLAEFSDPSIGPALVTRDRWNAYSPAVRDTALTVLTGNTNYIDALLTAIEKGDVPAMTVNGDRRGQLMRSKDEAISARATKLFKNLKPGDRMKIYEETKSVLSLTGDSKNGHAVFQKNCTACHVVSGEGHIVGPDLTGIRNQPKDVLLLHIVVPEYEIMPIYTSYNVDTKSGQSYTGLLASETPATITLRMSQGVEQQVPRSDIESMRTSRLSLMPQELEKAMTKQELADLLAFLKGE
jgi:putative membrane-bound dehydrogenase-like protein